MTCIPPHAPLLAVKSFSVADFAYSNRLCQSSPQRHLFCHLVHFPLTHSRSTRQCEYRIKLPPGDNCMCDLIGLPGCAAESRLSQRSRKQGFASNSRQLGSHGKRLSRPTALAELAAERIYQVSSHTYIRVTKAIEHLKGIEVHRSPGKQSAAPVRSHMQDVLYAAARVVASTWLCQVHEQ